MNRGVTVRSSLDGTPRVTANDLAPPFRAATDAVAGPTADAGSPPPG